MQLELELLACFFSALSACYLALVRRKWSASEMRYVHELFSLDYKSRYGMLNFSSTFRASLNSIRVAFIVS